MIVWFCPCCNARNFRHWTECFSCGAAQPRARPTPVGGKDPLKEIIDDTKPKP